jgi:hypothetical protein
MSYHRVCIYINTTGATSGAGTAYPQHRVHKTQDEDKQNNKHNSEEQQNVEHHRQYNDQKKKDKRTTNDLQSIDTSKEWNILQGRSSHCYA